MHFFLHYKNKRLHASRLSSFSNKVFWYLVNCTWKSLYYKTCTGYEIKTDWYTTWTCFTVEDCPAKVNKVMNLRENGETSTQVWFQRIEQIMTSVVTDKLKVTRLRSLTTQIYETEEMKISYHWELSCLNCNFICTGWLKMLTKDTDFAGAPDIN